MSALLQAVLAGPFPRLTQRAPILMLSALLTSLPLFFLLDAGLIPNPCRLPYRGFSAFPVSKLKLLHRICSMGPQVGG